MMRLSFLGHWELDLDVDIGVGRRSMGGSRRFLLFLRIE